MVMEKQGVVKPGLTRDVEHRLPGPGEKQGSAEDKTRRLDDDVTKRLADKAVGALQRQ
jgi:hypothetical protein